MAREPNRRPSTGFMGRVRSLWADRSGVGAVEFALIAPLLLMIYITVFELTIGLSVSKRVARASGAIADLVTQQSDDVPEAFLETMTDVADSIFVPYGLNDISIKISGITVNGNTARVDWSWDESGGRPYPLNQTVQIPDQMKVAGSFVVHTEVEVPHQLLMFMPGLLPSRLRNITIRRDSYFQSRGKNPITCKGC